MWTDSDAANITCGTNERLEPCGWTCPPEGCDDIGKQFKCPLQTDDNCISLCKCNLNYRRDTNGNCIPIKECPPLNCTGQNEVYNACPQMCPGESCGDAHFNGVCPYKIDSILVCQPTCRCAAGFFRNDNGLCIARSQCPIQCEDPNAHYSETDATSCQNTCQRPDLSTYCKPAGPKPGCICNEGYLKDAQGTCQPAEKCVNCEDPNAHYSLTLATPCQNTCAAPDLQSRCRPLAAQAGCVCNDGLVKNGRGLCINLGDCNTTVCGLNEHRDECPGDCPPETCAAIGRQYRCPAQPPPNCKAGCRCNLNHRRDIRGVCVPIQNCPPLICAGPNEVYDACPPNCPGDGCDQAALNGVCPFRIGIVRICRPACTCTEGYYRQGNTSLCIPQKDCFSCTGDNEEFRQNGPAIQPTCQNLYGTNNGFLANQRRSGCFCKAGFIRDSNKKCIKVETCYQDLCGKNEVRSCGSACDTTCATLNATCPIVNKQCNNMCYCQDGFARDDCGICIPTKQCPAKQGCSGDPNAVNVTCPNPCPDKCDSVQPKPGAETPACTRLCIREGCQCKDGFVQDETTNDKCVERKNCHKCTGPNEEWSRNVDGSCDDLAKCNSMVSDEEEGCRCIDGYVRDSNGICIQAGTCPRCGSLEEYTDCGTACPTTCSRPIQNVACIALCVKGCFCKPGLLRDKNGKCVEPDQCSAIGCNGDFDATNVTCPSPCPDTCTNYMQTNRVCPRFCKQFGCQCNEGFVLDENTNQCVLPANCPSSCDGDPNASNQTFSMSCRKTCDNIQVSNHICDDSTTVVGCNCNDGYVLDIFSGLCVTPDQCPPGCGGDVNAIYSNCGNNCPRSCDAIGKTVACPQLCVFGGGCVCKPGYFKGGPLNMCILPEECPRCGDNEIYSCGSACQTTCATLNDVCPIINIRCNDGCYCADGYARDAYGRCIPQTSCGRKVGCKGDANAYNSTCPAPCSVKCEDYAGSTAPEACDEYCPSDGKCVCNKGLILDQNTGYCVNQRDCDKCLGDNEVYINGFDVTCDEIASPNFNAILKSKNATLGCHCKVDTVRNVDGVCIPSSACQRCGPSEEYNLCGTACPKSCNNLYGDGVCTEQCIAGCFCKKPLVRDSSGLCVSPNECSGGCGGDINAYNGSYTVGCDPTCANREVDSERCSLNNVYFGCTCKKGFLYDRQSRLCVPPYECPAGCGGDPNAEYRPCGNICHLTCDNMDNPPFCPAMCLPAGACGCKANYVANSQGKCVRPTQCPLKQCTRDQVYQCPSSCGPSTCDDLENPIACTPESPEDFLFCTPRCVCKLGYLYNDAGDCVPAETCNSGCGGDPNASNITYSQNCALTCDNYLSSPSCDSGNMKVGCTCNPGFVNNTLIGKCITTDKCPPGCGGDENGLFLPCGDVCPRTCTRPTVEVCPALCRLGGGCGCKAGFVRGELGSKCILLNECPKTST